MNDRQCERACEKNRRKHQQQLKPNDGDIVFVIGNYVLMGIASEGTKEDGERKRH